MNMRVMRQCWFIAVMPNTEGYTVRRDNDWIWVLVMIAFALFAVATNAWNTYQVCKSSDVFWVSGTQYTCTLFK